MIEYHEYWQAIRTRICPRCIEGDGHGHCLLDPKIECALLTSMPIFVDIVTRSIPKKNPFKKELRTILCGECNYQAADGRCSLSEDTTCAAIHYFPEIVETIQHVYESRHQ